MPWTDRSDAGTEFGARVELFWAAAASEREVYEAIEELIANHPLDLIEALGRDVKELRDDEDPLFREGVIFGQPYVLPIAVVPECVDELPRAETLLSASANCECCGAVDVLLRPHGAAACSFTGEALHLTSAPLIMGRRPVLCAICLRDALWVSEKYRIDDLKMLNDAADLRAELVDVERHPNIEQAEKIDLVRIFGELLAKKTAAT